MIATMPEDEWFQAMNRKFQGKTDPTALCRWVAEELLGWKEHSLTPGIFPEDTYTEGWQRPDGYFLLDQKKELLILQSWHGIGLVIEAMSKRSEEEWTRFNNILKDVGWDDPFWWEHGEPWEIVYPAAQQAVEGETKCGA